MGRAARPGKGVADALLDQIQSWARARGAHTLRLDVVATNHSASTSYVRHGFVVAGEAPRTSDAEPLELRMVKHLPG